MISDIVVHRIHSSKVKKRLGDPEKYTFAIKTSTRDLRSR